MAKNYPGSMHNHTDFSNIRLRDSINKIPDIINYALELRDLNVELDTINALIKEYFD